MGNKHGTLKVLFWGGCVSLTGSILVGVFNYLIRRHLAVTLSAESYGFLYGAFSLLMLLMAFMDLGMSQGGTILMAQARSKDDNRLANSYFSLMLLTRAGLGSLLFVAVAMLTPYLVARYYKFASGEYVFIILALLLILQSTEGIAFAGLDALKAFTIKNIILCFRCLVLLVGIFVASNLVWVAIMFPLCALLSLAATYWTLSAKFGMKLEKDTPFHAPIIRQTWSLCRWIALGLVGITTICSIDSLLLTWYCGLNDVALYNIALPIVQIMQTLIILPVVFTPVVAELWQQHKTDEIGKLVSAVTVCMLIILFLLATAIVPTAKIIISLLFAPQFVAASTPLIILSLGVVFYAGANFYLAALNSGGKAFHGAAIMIAGAIFSITVNLFLIPRYGINGAALATTFSYFFISAISYLILSRRIHLHMPLRRVIYIICCGSAGIIAAITIGSRNSSAPVTLALTLILLLAETLLLTVPAWQVLQELLKFYREKQK